MGCPRLQKCCCFFDLKTGSIILGCIVAIISIGLFTTMLVITIEIGDIEKNIDKHLRILSEIEKAKDTGLRGPYALSIITVFMFLAKSLFDVFFIYGVCRERAGIIKSYLIMWVCFILLSVLIFFCSSSYYNIIIVATEICYLILNVYMVFVGCNFYCQIRRKGVI
ncbi:uncharacterized protein [Choristoneura fumiferana]|uniref:uncharacterized protein n=1 Tax=Choristoneura fumiferana TaxID=7141 RepID=UPI003D15CD82